MEHHASPPRPADGRDPDEPALTEALLLGVLDCAPTGVIIAEAPDGAIRLANATARDIRGPTDSPLTGITLPDHPGCWGLRLPDGSEPDPMDLPLALAVRLGETVREAALLLRRDNGEDRIITASATPVLNDDGQVLAGIMVFQDRTFLHLAEDSLTRAYGELDQIFNLAGDGMYVADLDSTILRMNRPLADILGLDPGDVGGRKCFELIPNGNCFTDKCPFPAIKAGARRVDCDFTRVLADGSVRHYIHTVTPFLDGGGRLDGVVGNVKDITERVRTEREAKFREQQLLNADKLRSLGVLVSGVAHEVNTPTGVITLNAPMLAKIWSGAAPILEEHARLHPGLELGGIPYAKARERVPELLDQVRDSANRIKRIVAELKDFSGQEPADLTESIDLNAVVKAATSLAGAKIRKSTRHFLESFSQRPIWVRGNFQQLEQVCINVLINACEALADDAQGIRVSTDLDQDSGMAVIAVRDQGSGMAPEVLDRAFDPFFTTKRESGGTGLGLSVSHGIVAEHGGRIDFESEPGKGTTCRVSLPLEGDPLPRHP